MDHEEMLKQARRAYGRAEHGRVGRGEGGESPAGRVSFPPSRQAGMQPAAFLDRLLAAAFEASPKLRHPFAVRLARGEWSKAQLQEWVRQDYQRTVCAIRRHALVAANSPDYEVIWALVTRVKAEADADPVGGVFFALPQLWIKFGISLGLSREEVTGARPHPLLQLLNRAMLDEVRFSGAVPVADFVNALLDPVFYRVWGDALENALRLPSDALDYFWAMAGGRWGEETGRLVFERMAATPESQAELWSRYRAEMEQGQEWHRLSILQTVLEAVAS